MYYEFDPAWKQENDLGGQALLQENYQAAEQHYLRSIEIAQEKSLSPMHNFFSRQYLAELYCRWALKIEGDANNSGETDWAFYHDLLAKAEQALIYQIDLTKKLFGPTDPSLIRLLTELSSIYRQLQQNDQWEDCLRQAYDLTKDPHFSEGMKACPMVNWGVFLAKKKKHYPEAERLIVEAVEKIEIYEGKKRNTLLYPLGILMWIYQETGRGEKVPEIQARIEEIEKGGGRCLSLVLILIGNLQLSL